MRKKMMVFTLSFIMAASAGACGGSDSMETTTVSTDSAAAGETTTVTEDSETATVTGDGETEAVTEEAAEEPTEEAEEVAVITPEEEAEPETVSYTYDGQIAVIAANEARWTDFDDSWGGSVVPRLSDMDQDGLLEISATLTAGTGIFTEMKIFEVNEQLSGIAPIDIGSFSDGNAPEYFIFPYQTDVSDNNNTGYYNAETDTYYYLMSDVWRSGYAEAGAVYYQVSLSGASLSFSQIGHYEMTVDSSGNESYTYTVGDSTYSTEEECDAALAQLMSGYQPFGYAFPDAYMPDYSDTTTMLQEMLDQMHVTF